MQHRSTYWLAVVSSLMLALALAACGSGSGSQDQQARQQPPAGQSQPAPTPGDGAQAHVSASNFAFALDTAEARAGQVTFVVTNRASDMPHDFALKGNGLEQKTAMLQPGQSATLSVDLQPGVYTYYCTIPGHDFLGMKGRFTVR